MSSGLTLSIALLIAVISLVAIVGFSALREGLRPLGLWLLAWGVHLLAAALVLWTIQVPAVRPVIYMFSSLVAPLMLMGAYAHVGRDLPSCLPSLGVLLGATRVFAYQMIGPEAASAIAAMTEPPIALFAAHLVLSPHPRETVSKSDQVLAVAFGLFAVAELSDAVMRFNHVSNWMVWASWVVLGLPLFATQLILYISRLGRIAASQERKAFTGEQRLRILAESIESIVVEFDEHGIITYLSAEARTGLAAEALIGRNAGDYFNSSVDSPIRKALEDHGRITEADIAAAPNSPTRVTLNDGRVAYYESQRATYRTEDGQLRIISQARNITDRILNEKETRDRERRLNRAEQIGQSGSWEFVPGTRDLYWSDHLYRLHGLEPSPGPVDQEIIRRMIEPEDLEVLDHALTSPMPEASYPDLHYRIRRAGDGELRSLQSLAEVEYDGSGRIERIHGTSRDITQQEELAAALRRGHEQLDLLIDSNIVGVFFADQRGEITRANDSFLTPLGYSEADLPLDWRKLTPKEGAARDDLALDELARTGSAQPYEKTFVARTGESIPTLIGCARVGPDTAIVIAVDLSERKRAETYIKRQQVALEATIDERTRELLQSRTRLMETQHLAAVGTLAAGVAHQINNPIGAILNSAEYALMCRSEENAHEIFQEALETNLSEARRCARIVRSMLQFSRDEPTEKWLADLNRVTQHAHRAIAAYAQDRRASVSVSTPADPILSRISPIELEQAIVNLLRNAIESSDEGADVFINLSLRDKAAELEVIDNGRGIEPKHLDHLFEPFYSTRTQAGGTGLGLSVAHGIICDHGGEIHIESVPGEGTRVLVSIPLVDS